MAEVRFLPEAEADAEAACSWYQARSVSAGDNFQAALDEAVERIGDFPESSALIDDEHRRRLFRRYPYSLVYRIETGFVLVVAVAHSSRLSTFWEGR